MSFFHFHEPLGFLNAANDPHDPYGTRSEQFESQSEKASGLLYGLTYWGDYGGDEISRYHYDTILENAPHLVSEITGNYGQGLVLIHVYHGTDSLAPDAREEFSGEFAFLAEFFRWALTGRLDYPIFDENSFSDWEWNKAQEVADEDIDNWIGWEVNRELDKLTDYEGEHAEPEEIREAMGYLIEKSEDFLRFENATTVLYPAGVNAEAMADYILRKRNGETQSHQGESLF